MNDGGPAFPSRTNADCEAFLRTEKDPENGMPYSVVEHPGITMRDYFASTASEEDIKHHQKTHNYNNELLSREAARYRYADAMLLQRATKTTT